MQAMLQTGWIKNMLRVLPALPAHSVMVLSSAVSGLPVNRMQPEIFPKRCPKPDQQRERAQGESCHQEVEDQRTEHLTPEVHAEPCPGWGCKSKVRLRVDE